MAKINSVGNALSGSTGSGAFVGANTPTLINPTTNTIQFSSESGLLDQAGNIVLGITSSTSAVNYIQAVNAATGIAPGIEALGSDTNVKIRIMGKGTSGSGIQGCTDASNATVGDVGQNLSSVITGGSAVSLSNATAKNLTSINLTAGDWLVWGNITFLPNTSASVNTIYAWLASTNSLALPDDSVLSGNSYGTTPIVSSGGDMGVTCIPFRISVSTTTTVYINADSVFSVSTMTMCGGIYATRMR